MSLGEAEPEAEVELPPVAPEVWEPPVPELVPPMPVDMAPPPPPMPELMLESMPELMLESVPPMPVDMVLMPEVMVGMLLMSEPEPEELVGIMEPLLESLLESPGMRLLAMLLAEERMPPMPVEASPTASLTLATGSTAATEAARPRIAVVYFMMAVLCVCLCGGV